MKQRTTLILVIVQAILFVILFYKQQIGLNLFVYELFTILSALFLLKIRPTGLVAKVILAGVILSGLSVIINYSAFAIFINIVSYFLFLGSLVYTDARSIITTGLLSITNTFQAVGSFFTSMSETKSNNKFVKSTFKAVKIGIIPIVIILIFISIYNSANPMFSKGLTKITDFIYTHFGDFFNTIDFGMVITFMFGLFFSIIAFYQVKNKIVLDFELTGSENIYRKRRKNNQSKTLALKYELKSAVLLLASLNVLILIINTIDIYWVWFNFEWEGEYLKQFVHEGTYLLIFSILISMAIVLFFFRENLNFYKNNRLLKILSYAWLAQNAVLVVSVAIRNYWYIQYFALAYKRIGVLFFLLLTLYGIYTVYMKVRHKKSVFYLLRTNALAAFCILVFIGLFNWDTLIAKYNFAHYKTAFVHFNFLSNLSDKALPYLDKDMETLKEIEQVQKAKFPFEEVFMPIDVYHKKIQDRRVEFMTRWDEKNLKSWNLAEAIAYKKLKNKSK